MVIGNGGHALAISENEFTGDIVAIGRNSDRKRVSEEYAEAKWGTAIHRTAHISRGVVIGEGTVIQAGAIIQPGASIGRHVILNTGSIIDHGSVIKDFAHVAPGAVICGEVRVGIGAFIGANAVCVPRVSVPDWYLVKAASRFTTLSMEKVDRFWARVDKDNDCWLWTGTTDPCGYGQVFWDKKAWMAHRLAWTLANGTIPEGMYLLHSCDNPRCVRPEHLRPGTQKENASDMVSRGRSRKGRKVVGGKDNVHVGTRRRGGPRNGGITLA